MMQPLELCRELVFTEMDEGDVDSDGASLPTGEENLLDSAESFPGISMEQNGTTTVKMTRSSGHVGPMTTINGPVFIAPSDCERIINRSITESLKHTEQETPGGDRPTSRIDQSGKMVPDNRWIPNLTSPNCLRKAERSNNEARHKYHSPSYRLLGLPLARHFRMRLT